MSAAEAKPSICRRWPREELRTEKGTFLAGTGFLHGLEFVQTPAKEERLPRHLSVSHTLSALVSNLEDGARVAAAGEESQSQGSRYPTHSSPTVTAPQQFPSLGIQPLVGCLFFKNGKSSLTQLGEFWSSGEAQLGGSGPGPLMRWQRI